METWFAQHWFNVLSALAFIGAVIVHYTKNDAHLCSIDRTLESVIKEVAKLKDGGLPLLCKMHEDRLNRIEESLRTFFSAIQTNMSTLQADIAELKQIAKDNRELIKEKRQ